MAINTRQKRASALATLGLGILPAIPPDGALTQRDFQHSVRTYSGVLAATTFEDQDPPAPSARARQVICRATPAGAGAVSQTIVSYGDPIGVSLLRSLLVSTRPALWGAAGEWDELEIFVDVAPGAGKSWTFIWWQNGSPTGMSVTISGTATSGRYSGAAIRVSARDTVLLQIVPSGTPDWPIWIRHTVRFTADNAGESSYGGNGGAGATSTTVAGSGTAPGGGGGGSESGNSGAGAAGRCEVYVF